MIFYGADLVRLGLYKSGLGQGAMEFWSDEFIFPPLRALRPARPTGRARRVGRKKKIILLAFTTHYSSTPWPRPDLQSICTLDFA